MNVFDLNKRLVTRQSLQQRAACWSPSYLKLQKIIYSITVMFSNFKMYSCLYKTFSDKKNKLRKYLRFYTYMLKN